MSTTSLLKNTSKKPKNTASHKLALGVDYVQTSTSRDITLLNNNQNSKKKPVSGGFIHGKGNPSKKKQEQKKSFVHVIKGTNDIKTIFNSLIFPRYLNGLKIYPKLLEILDCISNKAVTMVHAGTGSGKTVGIPRVVFEAILYGLISYKKIIVSVPTVLNVNFQHKYACEMNPESKFYIGKSCGGQQSNNYDFAKVIYATTQSVVNHLKYLYKTNPKKLNELIIMIDEAHHPSVENYVIHGLCNWLLSKGFTIKVIIATATPSAHPFIELNKAEKIVLNSTQFPVTVFWNKRDIFHGNFFDKEEINFAILSKLDEVVKKHKTGDILIFTSGENEVETLCTNISNTYRDFIVSPLYSSLPEEEIELISQNSSIRQIIVSTNVAESGVTIPGVSIVIDSITHKKLSITGNIRIIEEVLISQASSLQRRGRAGRTAPGFYYPLCTEQFFNNMQEFIENEFTMIPKHVPVINLMTSKLPADEILLISNNEYCSILAELTAMELIKMNEIEDSNNFSGEYVVTELGNQVSRYPLTIKSTISLLIAIQKFNVSLDDVKDRHENFYCLLHMVIAMTMIDARTSCPHMLIFLVTKEMTKKDTYKVVFLMNLKHQMMSLFLSGSLVL